MEPVRRNAGDAHPAVFIFDEKDRRRQRQRHPGLEDVLDGVRLKQPASGRDGPLRPEPVDV